MYYALMNSKKDDVYDSWEDCLQFISKDNKKASIIKKFDNYDDADQCLKDYIENNKNNLNKKVKKVHKTNKIMINDEPIEYPYSFTHGIVHDDQYFYGGLLQLNSRSTPLMIKGHGTNKELLKTNKYHRIIAEMAAVSNIIYKAYNIGLKKINIYYLYIGIDPKDFESKRNLPKSILQYNKFIKKYSELIDIRFIPIHKRTNDDGHRLTITLTREEINAVKKLNNEEKLDDEQIEKIIIKENRAYENIK